jgi:hypothetical protein
MSAKASTERQITGGDLRSRVRRITAGCVGLAAVASAALTINLAASADDNKASADRPAADAGVPAPAVTAPSTAQAPAITAPTTVAPVAPAPSTRSSTLAVPQQAPAASNGRSHTQSGGS